MLLRVNMKVLADGKWGHSDALKFNAGLTALWCDHQCDRSTVTPQQSTFSFVLCQVRANCNHWPSNPTNQVSVRPKERVL